MSWWPGSGRYSPFTSFYNNRGVPPVTEDDYSYLSGENDHSIRHNSYGFPSSHHNSTSSHHPSLLPHGSSGSHQEVAPDQLRLKYKGTVYHLHFEPFSISEGDLKVRDLRRSAARELGVNDARRIKLLYKGKQMRDDDSRCKHEGLKQNSEVMCVVSNEAQRSSSESDDQYDDSDSIPTSLDGSRDDASKKKRKGHRGGKSKKKDRRDDAEPPHAASATPTPRLAPPTDPHQQTSRTPSPSPKKPTTPAEMLADIENNFDANYAPKAREYLAHPPPDAKTKETEYKRISETILTQVLLKLDGVETMGNESLRARRKELVKRIQGVLAELDVVGKAK